MNTENNNVSSNLENNIKPIDYENPETIEKIRAILKKIEDDQVIARELSERCPVMMCKKKI